jgi:hypothetical protein
LVPGKGRDLGLGIEVGRDEPDGLEGATAVTDPQERLGR